MSSALVDYYRQRAREYELIYEKPERQADLAVLKERLSLELAGLDVLEIACGTGFWTEVCAGRAHSMLAVDLAEETLAIARAKEYPFGKVRFGLADAYCLEDVPGSFTAGLASFWWSHIPRERIPEFLAGWHRRLGAGARVVFMDNRFVAGSSSPISRTDAQGNTFQLRTLQDSTTHEVLKNFQTGPELLAAVADSSTRRELVELPYYWCLSYTVV
jgi:demethylmenaquinone methyltransferase/2-methoxy-6-polyprenyl-1,4-benzoquinol methylase